MAAIRVFDMILIITFEGGVAEFLDFDDLLDTNFDAENCFLNFGEAARVEKTRAQWNPASPELETENDGYFVGLGKNFISF